MTHNGTVGGDQLHPPRTGHRAGRELPRPFQNRPTCVELQHGRRAERPSPPLPVPPGSESHRPQRHLASCFHRFVPAPVAALTPLHARWHPESNRAEP